MEVSKRVKRTKREKEAHPALFLFEQKVWLAPLFCGTASLLRD